MFNNPLEDPIGVASIIERGYKGVQFAVVRGDITQLTSETNAIVVPSDDAFDFTGSAVGGALTTKYDYHDLCEAIAKEKRKRDITGPVEEGTTLCIEFDSNKIIFVNATPPGKPGALLFQSTDGVRKIVGNCLNEAASQNCQSISFPAIGTGVWDLPLEQSIEATVSASQAFIDAHNGDGATSLNRIELVLYEPTPKDSTFATQIVSDHLKQ